ncbi:related to Splicing factor U2AF-associated protein 2 [Ustilago bromivora]|uniref:Related to Splicing factor U2AF-associated protein 2 n=1 Tax=Ustilago bromivora TaxID=307758 RepID=A0A1K0GVT1_9BASI|nr:related to Splicing factor U2AF-associated protein 2 [Ustilago bromivora]SYW76336.1 related to Splicing factor U2AF-associated protein 2 [Ustilago bromivora]
MHPAPPATGGSEDPRVYLYRVSGNWRYEDESGQEWEWQAFLHLSRPTVDLGESEEDPPSSSSSKPSSSSSTQPVGHWVKVLDEDLLSTQQAAYSIAGVDECQPSQAVLRRSKKRPPSPSNPTCTPAERLPPSKKPKPITSLYITGLPLDATQEEIARVFSRYGVLLEDDEGKPRVKMYYDERTGVFRGEALVVYFKAESVELAIRMLDETSLRGAIGGSSNAGGGPVMRVQRAQFPATSNNTTPSATAEKQEESTNGKDKGQSTTRQRRNLTDQERKNIAKRVAKLENKLSDWRDDDPPSRSSLPLATTSPPTRAAKGRTVVLTKMFTLHELDSDPTLLLDLKEDVRDECTAKIGGVTNVVLWDKEPAGIMTVRFQTEQQAEACVKMMKARYFAQRSIDAWLADVTPSFKKSRNPGAADDEASDAEQNEAKAQESRRKHAFGAWLEEA